MLIQDTRKSNDDTIRDYTDLMNYLRHQTKRVIRGGKRRIIEHAISTHDRIRLSLLRMRNPWPCMRKQNLVVGCESSGTTVICKLLFCGSRGRFLVEDSWIWRAYMSIYEGKTTVEDYPQLLLFQNVKVPGFASILPQYKSAFPNSSVLYVVRDPRDVLASAIRTFKIENRNQLLDVSWVQQNWLNIDAVDPVERLAYRWSRYLDASRQATGVTYIRYEDFCSDKVETIRGLCEQFSIPFDHNKVIGLMNKQASHESTRNYKPAGSGTWKSNKLITQKDVSIIEEICAPQMKAWGYLD